MIERVRDLCRRDERLVGALMYGSFAQEEGDEFSDIEFVLFLEDHALPQVDQEEWVSQIAPVELYFVNEFGNGTAIFDNLIRGEFHFDRASDILKVNESWKDTDWLPSLDAALILDRTGVLSRRLEMVVGPPLVRDTPEQVQFLCHCFVNWFLFGSNLLCRGELARSLDFLNLVQRQLLWMIRTLEHSTAHWANPSKNLEKDISRTSYARFAACTANLDEQELWSAYHSAWDWGKEMMLSLALERHHIVLPTALIDRIGKNFTRCGEAHRVKVER